MLRKEKPSAFMYKIKLLACDLRNFLIVTVLFFVVFLIYHNAIKQEHAVNVWLMFKC